MSATVATMPARTAERAGGAQIEHAIDPHQPNRIGYRITGATREAVQIVIDNLTASVDGGFGYANFVGPARRDGEFFALGQVVIYTPAVRL